MNVLNISPVASQDVWHKADYAPMYIFHLVYGLAKAIEIKSETETRLTRSGDGLCKIT